MRNSALDLSEYVERRVRLAGGALVAASNPFNIPWDTLSEEMCAAGQNSGSFAHYDYLGLAGDARVRAAAIKAVEDFGPGVSASRLVGGERTLHRAFEAELAEFVGHEAALCTVSGYGLNVSLIGHLLSSTDLIIYDEHSHNSVLTGVGLTRATSMAFRHNDLDHLEYLLGRYGTQHKRILVVAEGIYSMDGDLPDLPRLIDIKERYGAWLMLDEAHSIGMLGRTGRGISQHFGIDPKNIEFIVGTLSKSFLSCGGFVCASEAVIYWLRHTLPCYVYSVGTPPPVIAASREVLSILQAEPERVKKLHEMSRYALMSANSRGLSTGRAAGIGIIPILFPSTQAALHAFTILLEMGFYVPPIVTRAVSNDHARLRMFICANHDKDAIDRVFDALCVAAQKVGMRTASVDNVSMLPSARRTTL